MLKRYNDAGAWLAVKITGAVGSMTCAYLFALWAIAGIPAALEPHGIGIVNWFAEEFLQLVLLSIIIVGQNIQAKAAETRAIETHDAVMEELADVREILSDLRPVNNPSN